MKQGESELKDTSNLPEHLFIVREWGSALGLNVELYKCLQEYYGKDKVIQVVVPNESNILVYILGMLRDYSPKTIWVDTRIFIVDAHIRNLHKHLKEVSQLNFILNKLNIVPICVMTDSLSAPGYQLVGELLIRNIGILIPLGANPRISGFSKNYQVLDVTNPISLETSDLLLAGSDQKSEDVYLGGLQYEPRRSFLLAVQSKLNDAGLTSKITQKTSNSYLDYLKEISRYKIVVNTNFIVNSNSKHMVARNIEALHAGSLLLTQRTPRLEKILSEGLHYIGIETPDDVVLKVIHYLKHEEEAREIAIRGQTLAHSYAKKNYFVRLVDLKVQEIQRDKL